MKQTLSTSFCRVTRKAGPCVFGNVAFNETEGMTKKVRLDMLLDMREMEIKEELVDVPIQAPWSYELEADGKTQKLDKDGKPIRIKPILRVEKQMQTIHTPTGKLQEGWEFAEDPLKAIPEEFWKSFGLVKPAETEKPKKAAKTEKEAV